VSTNLAAVVLAVEEGAEETVEAPNPILPEANEIIWGALAFLVLFVAFVKFAWPGVKKAMDDRTERIRSSLDEAERTRAEAQSVLEQYQAQLQDARNESARIIDDARQTADAMRGELQTRAEQEMAEMRQRHVEQLAADRERVMTEVGDSIRVLAIELAEKVVGSNLDREANLRLIESYINEVGDGAGARR
jgi:F-type H+-transporting ATPase subunit b